MIDAQQPEPIRLVPLVEAAPDASQQSHILALAAEGRLRLYVQRRPGQAVYAGSAKRSLSNSITPMMQEQVNEARRRNIPVIHNLTPCREIDFLALAPKDAQGLLVARVACVQQFPGGLKPISTEVERQQSWLEFVPAQLYLRPIGGTVGHGPWILEAGEHAIKVERPDVFLSERDAKEPEEDDCFQFRLYAPGVFVLCAAAKHFFGPNPPDSFNQDAVKKWLLDHRNQAVSWAYRSFNNYEELATEANRRLAYKLIDTRYDLDKIDRRKRPSKPLDAKALQKAMAYRRGGYVSDRLSLVALAVKHWAELTEANPAPEGGAAAIASHQLDLIDKLRREVRKWGVDSGSEQLSIVDFVTWPKLAADYRKARKE